jgi:hypothetical protein
MLISSAPAPTSPLAKPVHMTAMHDGAFLAAHQGRGGSLSADDTILDFVLKLRTLIT